MKKLLFFILISCAIHAQSAIHSTEPEFIPIEHASFVIRTAGVTIFVDPVGTAQQYESLGAPDIILFTHEHGDHLNIPLLSVLKSDKTEVIGSPTVIDKIGYGRKIGNHEKMEAGKVSIEALPAYNTTPERQKFHPQGRGNGYVVTIAGKRIYISGDTEDIPDMRALKNIDYAFVCMNLPYTMSVEQAASALLEMKPAHVIPYHYRNQDKTYSDVKVLLPELLSGNKGIKVEYLDWYKKE